MHTFTWDKATKQFVSGTTTPDWKHQNTATDVFAFKGVFPAMNPLGVDEFVVTNSTALGHTTTLFVLDETATGCTVACYAGNTITFAGLCKGEFAASGQTITWTGAINETWTYLGPETLQQTVTDRVVFAIGQGPELSAGLRRGRHVY